MRLTLAIILLVLVSGCTTQSEKQVEPTTTVVTTTIVEVQSTVPANTVEETTTTSVPTTSTIAPVVILPKVAANCIGFLVGAPDEIQSITVVGGGWVRPHPGPYAWGWIEKTQGDFDFKVIDEYVRQAQENNVGILATVWPYADWDQNTCHGSECEVSERDIFYPRTGGSDKNLKEDIKDFIKKPGIDYLKDSEPAVDGIPKMRCIPCSIDDYKNFLRKLVERYDGNGVDDMDGLKMPVQYYEILNEPSMQEGDLTFFKGMPAEYVKILKASYDAIKEACPECKVVHGGASGSHDEPIEYWDQAFKLGAGNYFDIANIHFVNYGDVSTLNVKDFKKLMRKNSIDKPVWVTESEFQTMDDIDAAVTGALNAGADKIFFPGFGAGHGPLKKAEQFTTLYENQVAKCN